LGSDASVDGNHKTFQLKYMLPRADLFHRNQPAIDEGPQEAWAAARTVIDFAAALIAASGAMPATSQIRRAVLTALLRRAAVTAEGIWWLLARGLEEPAVAATRTLLDTELNTKLVARDRTDTMAKRLAAYHYHRYQRHGQKMLGDYATRTALLKYEEGITSTVNAAKSYAEFLKAEVFDEVRRAVQSGAYWHGYATVAEAFAAVEAQSDYRTLYDTFTAYVHASNVDADFADIVNGTVRLKPVVQRNPELSIPTLSNAVLRLYSVIRNYCDSEGVPAEFRNAKDQESSEHPDVIQLDGVNALAAFVVEHFGELTNEDDVVFTDEAG